MARIFVTIFEETTRDAIEAIRAIREPIDGLELRVDALDAAGTPATDLPAIRRSADLPMIFTRRSTEKGQAPLTPREAEEALGAGFDLIDVELNSPWQRELLTLLGDRAILSHHDYLGADDAEIILDRMRAAAVRTKIAITPRTFDENLRILRLAERCGDGSTVIGMGEYGLYSRILAPFFGSEIVFAATGESRTAAPGQLTLSRALAIYGDDPSSLSRPHAIFCVVGHPVAHSLSPSFHNDRFRSLRVSAAYSMADVESFGEILQPFLRCDEFAPVGMSVTSPFKIDAFRAAVEHRWELGPEVIDCGSVNTLVRLDAGRVVARNTDAEGFLAALRLVEDSHPRMVAVIGAGGSGRAAAWAAKEAGFDVTVFNRTREKGERVAAELGVDAAPLEALEGDFSAILNTVTAGANVSIPREAFKAGRLFVDVAYAEGTTGLTERAREAGMIIFDGHDLFEAQAYTQSKLFVAAAESANRMVQ